MKISVEPEAGWRVGRLSRVRTEVEPTAMMRPLCSRAWRSFSAVCGLTS